MEHIKLYDHAVFTHRHVLLLVYRSLSRCLPIDVYADCAVEFLQEFCGPRLASSTPVRSSLRYSNNS
jgi:hypothetical protein